jgi:hypothetical protein
MSSVTKRAFYRPKTLELSGLLNRRRQTYKKKSRISDVTKKSRPKMVTAQVRYDSARERV